MMARRGVLCGGMVLGLLTLAAPGVALAQGGADVQRVSNYLNALTTLTGTFVQTNPDGSISEGTFSIRKPGLMRFEYAPPNPALVISDGVWVGVLDRSSNSDAQRYPLGETPLDLLLRDRVDLKKEGAVQKVEKKDGQLRVTAIDPGNRKAGSLTLILSDNPLELRQWIVTDEAGEATTVVLGAMRRDVELNRALFSIESAELDR